MSQYCILVATDLTDDSIHLLEAAEDVTVKTVTPTVAAIRGGLQNIHALIARDDVLIDEDLLNHAPELKIIGRVAANLTGIDIEVATERGIMVMNTPGVSTIAAAEHTLTLMLALSRRLIAAHNSLKDGGWLLDRKQQAGTQLKGKTLGIIGIGQVGTVVAQRALAFGMTVLAYDPYVREDHISDERIFLVGLKELLTHADFISVHVPSTAETHHIIDTKAIEQMKPGARLINISFGTAIDDHAIAQALKEGHLGGVAVDVYSEEPPYNSPLVGLDTVIHTPHIADNTVEATQDLSIQIVKQVLDALRGTDYRNVVNLPFMPGVDFETIHPYLSLAECVGTLLHVLSRSPVRRVAVEYRGEEVAGLTKPLTVALLKGLLKPVLGESVSYINAPVLASERGMQVTQAKGLKTGDYANIVSCQVTLENDEDIVMAGVLLDHKVPHIVQINNYRMNFVAQGHLLIMGSYDKPGVIGRVGMLMADNSINVGSWQTGRDEPGGNTLTVLTLDEEMPDDVLDTLRQQDFIRHAHKVRI